MNKTKNIFEKIRMYKINSKKKKKEQEKIKKEENGTINKKSYSKIKIFFKMIFGYIISIFEYLTLQSNKKNNTKIQSNANIKKKENNILNQINNNDIKKNINFSQNLKKEICIQNNYQKKETNSKSIKELSINIQNKDIDNKLDYDLKNNKNIKNNKILINNQNKIIKEENKNEKNSKILEKQEITKKQNLIDVKNKLILIEDSIIYASNFDELENTKQKILTIKKELKENPSNENNLNNNKEKNEITNILKEKKDSNLNIELNKSEQKKIEEPNIVNNEDNKLSNKDLIKRCDDDLELIEKKENYLEIQSNYEKEIKNIINENNEFKITKKDLKQIKNTVSSILASQQKEFEKLKKFIENPTNPNSFIVKMQKFFKNTAKLSFSFIPFLAFPNKLVGLTTSAIMVNNSIKSMKKMPNNYINENLNLMINSKDFCLKIGINMCEDSLNEIDNIKYYLKNLPNNIKDSKEYREYLLEVISTEKQIETQINALKKISKNYSDIKVKVKKQEY